VIRLSRMGGQGFVLNAELIEYLESTPDTVITLVGGKTVMVRESVDLVVRRILRYRRRIRLPLVKKPRSPAPESNPGRHGSP
jgi:flagellar protein FlbD